MALKNSLAAITANPNGKPKFSEWLKNTGSVAINNAIPNQAECNAIMANLATAVVTNPALADCSYPSIISAGLLANSLKLSLSPAIGLCYIVPFDDKKKGKTATFILGWKGYLQLAIRSGYYERINIIPVKKGEVVKIDEFTETYIFKRIDDDEEREKAETIGYYAYFKYDAAHGGFTKALYWSKQKMLKHADRYSKAFHLDGVKSNDPLKSRVSYEDFVAGKYPKSDEWKYSSYWYQSFDDMALKTMVRQLIGKYGIMSTDFQRAYESDGGEVNNDLTVTNFVENDNDDTKVIAESKDDEEMTDEDLKAFYDDEDGNGDKQTVEPIEEKPEQAEQPKPAKRAKKSASDLLE